MPQTMKYGKIKQSKKYQLFTSPGCKDIGIRACKFVEKTYSFQFSKKLYN